MEIKYSINTKCCYCCRKESGEFEALDLTAYSSPPDLPDVMKSQETNGQEQVCKHCFTRVKKSWLPGSIPYNYTNDGLV